MPPSHAGSFNDLRHAFPVNSGLVKEDITAQRLADARMVVIGAPKAKFSTNEFTALQAFIDRVGQCRCGCVVKGRVWMCGGE